MSVLFEPANIGEMEVKNRFVRSATAEGACDEAGNVTDKLLNIYRNLAKGGVGLIITGHAYVQPNGRCSADQMGIYRDDLLPGLTELAEVVHKTTPDCKIAVQITHAGRQTSRLNVSKIVAPSAVTDRSTGITPRAMTEAEIEECIDSFAHAAGRAKLAGFDGVQIHSAHGYLVSSFNSPHTNVRTDKWGGDLQNRMRFLIETYRRIRTKVGSDYPVFVKLNASDFADGGIEIDESARIARMLAEEGVDAIEVSGGTYESYKGKGIIRMRIRKPKQEAYFLPLAEEIKEAVGDVPVILVGGLRSVSVMEKIAHEGKADFISVCRPLIREPDLPHRIKEGKDKADCISCNGCMSSRVDVIRCVQIERGKPGHG
jgi:2,4-dienoyl-CoA reductase-like NADH-dependent reductase (Old Yellow Enzyme family)